MAPRTRAASAAAAAATCLLLDLSHDEVSIVTHELCDPLQPLLAVHLSSTAKGLREAMEEQLAELRQQRQGAAAFAALCGWSCTGLRAATYLLLGASYDRPLTIAPSPSPTGGRWAPSPAAITSICPSAASWIHAHPLTTHGRIHAHPRARAS